MRSVTSIAAAATICCGLLFYSLSAMAQQDVNSLVAQLDSEYDRSWNTLDPQKVAGLYADDAIFIPATGPASKGASAVLAFFQMLFKDKWSEHKLEVITAERLSDNTVVAASRWSANLTDPAGKATRYGGDVAQVFEKQGDQWKLRLVTFNVLPDRT